MQDSPNTIWSSKQQEWVGLGGGEEKLWIRWAEHIIHPLTQTEAITKAVVIAIVLYCNSLNLTWIRCWHVWPMIRSCVFCDGCSSSLWGCCSYSRLGCVRCDCTSCSGRSCKWFGMSGRVVVSGRRCVNGTVGWWSCLCSGCSWSHSGCSVFISKTCKQNKHLSHL